MIRSRTIKKKMWINLPLLFGGFLCLYFLYHAYLGVRSFDRLSSLYSIADEGEEAYIALKQERGELSAQVEMMRSGSVSADVFDEQARYILGHLSSKEYVVFDN